MWHGWLADEGIRAVVRRRSVVLIEDVQRRKGLWLRRKVRLKSKRKEEAATANGA